MVVVGGGGRSPRGQSMSGDVISIEVGPTNCFAKTLYSYMLSMMVQCPGAFVWTVEKRTSLIKLYIYVKGSNNSLLYLAGQ